MVIQSVPAELHGQGSVAFSPAFFWFQVISANSSVSQVCSPGKTKKRQTFRKDLQLAVISREPIPVTDRHNPWHRRPKLA